MKRRTFVEKIFGSPANSIVFCRPDIVLSHDNTASIEKTFRQMHGKKVADPDQLLIVLDHNAPPTTSKLANEYQQIRDFIKFQGVKKFYDSGKGICHQIMSYHAKPGMLIVGSDSHTCTAGAFNSMAAGIDRTETAGIWLKGETWFRVPESLKIILKGRLRKGVYAKDLSLWIIGMLGSDGANYMSIEFHGPGVASLSISDRMTLANLASEMGAKNAIFPPDQILAGFYNKERIRGIWADDGATYASQIEINLSEIFPLVAAPHSVDNIKSVNEVKGISIDQGLIGTCTNGRIEDLRIAAGILKGRKIKDGFQLFIIPASQQITLQAIREGLIEVFLHAGAQVLSSSCGPCLGTGQGIPADGSKVISTANRNFPGRMGNKNGSIYLASPATVAYSAIEGNITNPMTVKGNEIYPYSGKSSVMVKVPEGETRKYGNIWNYSDVDNLNTDQMFAGNLTYNILSSDPRAILPHLFSGFDAAFCKNLKSGDIIIGGENFGCGSSREHPSVGLAYAGIKGIIVKSVNRIFFRSCINQGLPLIVHKQAVDEYKPGAKVEIDFFGGEILIDDCKFKFAPLPDKLLNIIENKGLVNWIKKSNETGL